MASFRVQNPRPRGGSFAGIASFLVLLLFAAATTVGAAERKSPTASGIGAASVRGNESSVRLDPEPPWVVAAKVESVGKIPNASMYFASVDNQIRIGAKDFDRYVRVVKVVAESAGLSAAAQFIVSFDPSYESLHLHRLGIWRDGRYLDRLKGRKIELLHRETRLEYRVYDGQLTASVNLDDLRVGDRVEYAYTVSGMNPVFEGRVAHTVWAVSDTGPIENFRARVLVPEGRAVSYRSGADMRTDTNRRNGVTETTFERRDVAQLRYDPSAPESLYLNDQIQIGEFSGWNEVARWGERLFRGTQASTPVVRAKAETIKAAATTDAERLRLALDFVQNEVRYFGVEMGTGSHQPADPGKVLAQRYGDCKDKTSLLIGLLREMGIPAVPVLVSTRLHGDVTSALPSPLAFDHVVARVDLDGVSYWLDSTRSNQTGPVSDRQTSFFAKGLVLDASAEGLATLPDSASRDRVAVSETIRVAGFQSPPTLESRVTYFGELAEYMRQSFATQPIGQLESQFSSDYGRLYDGISSVSPLRLEDVPGRNAVSIVQRFVLPKFWSFPEERVLTGEVALWGVAQAVKFPEELGRKSPLRIPWPGIHRHQTVIEYPEDVAKAPSSSRFDDGDARFSFSVVYESTVRQASASAEIRLLVPVIPAEEWTGFQTRLRELRTRFGSSFSAPAITIPQSERLTDELRNLEEGLRKGKISPRPATRTQVTARFRDAVLTAQLQGGRLNDGLRAQALHQRGIQRDNLGAPDKAAEDFAEALRLDPGNAKIQRAAAVNASNVGDDALAMERIERAITLAPSETEAYKIRADISYFLGDFGKARGDLERVLQNPAESERSYSVLWLYLATRRAGGDATRSVAPFLPKASRPGWPYPVLQYYLGAGNFDQAYRAARETPEDPTRLCELYFYAGEKAALEGDTASARDYFRRSMDTGVVEFKEYVMARRRLQALR